MFRIVQRYIRSIHSWDEYYIIYDKYVYGQKGIYCPQAAICNATAFD